MEEIYLKTKKKENSKYAFTQNFKTIHRESIKFI